MNCLAVPTASSAPRGAIWFAIVLTFAALVLPDCCVNGQHAFGAGMSAFGPICRAAR
jgi:hypothetical protein